MIRYEPAEIIDFGHDSVTMEQTKDGRYYLAEEVDTKIREVVSKLKAHYSDVDAKYPSEYDNGYLYALDIAEQIVSAMLKKE